MPSVVAVLATAAVAALAPGERRGAPEPPSPPFESPLSPADQLRTFSLAPGFSIELVAADPDVAKTVAIAFDDAGRLWLTTALEYPLDGNENPDAAKRLFESGGRDKILVIDRPHEPGPHRTRVFADGLAMPMGLLPAGDGAIVGEGPRILRLRDTDGDGRADGREVLYDGFGIEDSHLFPHGFTRGPGEWIYCAQGAFNHSKVRSLDGAVVPFDQCKIGRFRADGSRFEVAAVGLNNVWGFDFDRSAEFFAQEANDLGYPVVPFFLNASWPGIGGHRFRPYAPFLAPLAEFRMGGTGLSGLALASDRDGFPLEWRERVAFVANPIARKIQAIRIEPDAAFPGSRLEKLPDFVNSSDPWFRPIALRFGPDGCLYVVDFYNKIISHNEVPRTHPERDKTRGRIWRIRADAAPRRAPPDMTRVADADLVPRLAADSTWEARAAWHQIVDRKATSLAPELRALAASARAGADARLLALFSLEGLSLADPDTLRALAASSDRALRREAVRAAAAALAEDAILELVRPLAADPDDQVRHEVIRALGAIEKPTPRATALLASLAREPLEGRTVNPEGGGGPVLVGAASERAFERFLVRLSLERHGDATLAFLDSAAGRALPAEARFLASLSVSGEKSAPHVAGALAALARPLGDEELLAALAHPDDAALAALFRKREALEGLLRVRTRFDAAPLRETIAAAALALPRTDAAARDLALRLGASFRLREVEPLAIDSLEASGGQDLAALRALREIGTDRVDLLASIAEAAPFESARQKEAVLALAAAPADVAAPRLLALWPALGADSRAAAADRLSRSKSGARALLLSEDAVRTVSDTVGNRIRKLLGAEAEAVLPALPKVLRLSGGNDDYADTDVSLAGAFTVEAWVRLDPPIGNEDGILGVPGGADFNFAGGLFRAYAGPGNGDKAIATTRTNPEAWTHVAATRDEAGIFRIYMNGELDAVGAEPFGAPFEGLDVGRTTPGHAGTAGEIDEFRVWRVARSPDEIRASFERRMPGAPPSELTLRLAGDAGFGRLSGAAEPIGVAEAPPIATEAEAAARAATFERYRRLAASADGDAARGKAVFESTCLACHTTAATARQGAFAPSLAGASLRGTENLLRALLSPSLAVEPGYRRFVVTTRDERILDGFKASEDEDAIVLRPIAAAPADADVRVPRSEILSAAFTRGSLMPEGLLQAMPDADVAALFAYLRTL